MFSSKHAKVEKSEPLSLESNLLNGSFLVGLGCIVLAIAWFFVGYFVFDRIFIYPPILLVIGLVAVVKNLIK